MTNLRMWRREHSANIIAEVTPASGIGSWAACVWRLQADPHRTEAGRHFALPTDAHTAADQLAAFTFQHRCDTACGKWIAVERPLIEDPARVRPRGRKSVKTPVKAAAKDKSFRKGDVIVTAVAHHYSIGRIQADRHTQEHLGSEKNRALALTRACQFATGFHRVFLYHSAGESKFTPFDCQEIRSITGRRLTTSTPRRDSGARDSAAEGSAPAAPTTAPRMRKRDQTIR
jgi:hypothetical protein